MTTLPPLAPDDDALAAEYVLGVLDLPDRIAVERRMTADPVFAAAVAGWTERLAPLNAGYAEIVPPDLLPRIEARLFPTPPRARRGWFGFLGAAVAAAVIAVAVMIGLPRGAPSLTAVLETQAGTGTYAFAARIDPASGALTLTRTAGADPDADRVLQLWSIGADGVPVSLGLIDGPDTTRTVPGIIPGLILAVSLEPAGGSPTGQPTGPVVAMGSVVQPGTSG